MKYRIALLTTASLAMVASPAMAQQTNTAFTGPRVEALVGYDSTRAGSDIDNDVNEDDDQSIDGVIYGAAIGYDFAAGGALIGVEAELTDSTADVEISDGDVEDVGLGDVDTGRDIYVGLRAGFLAQPDLLLYAKGGYTNARYNFEPNFSSGDGEDEFRTSIDTDGFRVGAGLEYALSERGFLKVEYRYSNYSSGEVDFENDNIADSEDFDVDLDRHQVVVGYGIRF